MLAEGDNKDRRFFLFTTRFSSASCRDQQENVWANFSLTARTWLRVMRGGSDQMDREIHTHFIYEPVRDSNLSGANILGSLLSWPTPGSTTDRRPRFVHSFLRVLQNSQRTPYDDSYKYHSASSTSTTVGIRVYVYVAYDVSSSDGAQHTNKGVKKIGIVCCTVGVTVFGGVFVRPVRPLLTPNLS